MKEFGLDDTVLSESDAILFYLAEKSGKLFPGDARVRAKVAHVEQMRFVVALGDTGQWVALAVVVALNLVSERVSFTRVIDDYCAENVAINAGFSIVDSDPQSTQAFVDVGVPPHRAAFFGRLAVVVLVGAQHREETTDRAELHAMYSWLEEMALATAIEAGVEPVQRRSVGRRSSARTSSAARGTAKR